MFTRQNHPKSAHAQPLLVFIVDDDKGMRSLLRQLLESENLQVIEVCNGAEALKLYHHHLPDLILLDAMMPIMDGFTCCQQLCQCRPERPVPILMITSLKDEASIVRAFEAGASDYVTKPINELVLRQRVQKLIQQFRLMQQVQRMNEVLANYTQTLNLAIQERTAKLERSLEFEAVLKHITDHVRESLDQETILQRVVQELANVLGLVRCNVALYNANRQISHVQYEFITSGVDYQHRTIQMHHHPEIYQQLLKGESVQFCSLSLCSKQERFALFAFPIKNGSVIGDIWLTTAADRILDSLEIRLIQQVTNQCAITFRQAQLYKAAQSQVKELERLNQLKDAFLSTVSHELRSPMANIQLASRLLETTLTQSSLLPTKDKIIERYLKILRQEGEREISLINDLLDLSRLEADVKPLTFIEIDLSLYIYDLAERFIERIQQQQQQLILQVSTTLPLFKTDLPYLERILTELLHNACKYTPTHETISLCVHDTPAYLEFQVCNTGVEIPPTEFERIFDKFYRIPNNDPWKHEGTGLGLALVKRLVKQLGGTVHVESGQRKTAFIVRLSILPESTPFLKSSITCMNTTNNTNKSV